MALVWRKQVNTTQESQTIARRLVRPALSDSGAEKFGIINNGAIATPYSNSKNIDSETTRLTAAVRLNGAGLNRWLNQGRDTTHLDKVISQALPPYTPAQFLLRKRNGQLAEHYSATRQNAFERLKDSESAHFFLQDYLENLVYPLEDTGLSETWFGVLLSAASEEELTHQLANFMVVSPYEATPCTSKELSNQLTDYFAPALYQNQLEADEQPSEELYAEWFAQEPFEVTRSTVFNGKLHAFWSLRAMPPATALNWTLPLLSLPALKGYEFDIVVNLVPAARLDTMQEIAQRRLAMLDTQIEELRQAIEDEDVADELAELLANRKELKHRLNATMYEGERHFEANITIALHAEPEVFSQQCTFFEEEMQNLGWQVQRTVTAAQTQAAFWSCAPLNQNSLPYPLALPAQEAGNLALLAPGGQAEMVKTSLLAGVSSIGEPLTIRPTNQPGEVAFFLTGNGEGSTQNLAEFRHLALMRWLAGSFTLGLDFNDGWQLLVERAGGNYLAAGEPTSAWHFNPLEFLLNNTGLINQKNLQEAHYFIANLLELSETQQTELLAILIETVVANKPISPANIMLQAETSGYRELGGQLREICPGGKWGWLLSRPSRVPQNPNGLVFFGIQGLAKLGWTNDLQLLYAGLLYEKALGWFNPAGNGLLVVENSENWLTSEFSRNRLLEMKTTTQKAGYSTWLTSNRADAWLTSYRHRPLFEKAQSHFFMSAPETALPALARRLKLPVGMVQKLKFAVAGWCWTRNLNDQNQAEYSGFKLLPENYLANIANLLSFKKPLQISREPRQVASAIEFSALFAPEEMWQEEELEKLMGSLRVEVNPLDPATQAGEDFIRDTTTHLRHFFEGYAATAV